MDGIVTPVNFRRESETDTEIFNISTTLCMYEVPKEENEWTMNDIKVASWIPLES